MAKKKQTDEDEVKGVLHPDRRPDQEFTSSTADFLDSGDYNPEDDIDPRVSGDKPGVLENRPSVSDPQGMDDPLTFTQSDDKDD